MADQPKPKNISRGILEHGKGHMKDVTTTRIRPQDMGVSPAEENATVVKLAAKSADVKLSAGGTRAHAALAAEYGAKKADAAAALAAEWAANRGCKRVWDIDFATAVGYPRTPEGAKNFRVAFGLTGKSGVSTDWPSKVSETPTDETPVAQMIDLITGKVGNKVSELPGKKVEPEEPKIEEAAPEEAAAA